MDSDLRGLLEYTRECFDGIPGFYVEIDTNLTPPKVVVVLLDGPDSGGAVVIYDKLSAMVLADMVRRFA